MKLQLMEKLRQYTDAGWWTAKAVPQAAPLLCIPKKLGKLRTVIDCRQRNENTIEGGVKGFAPETASLGSILWGVL